MIYCIPYTAHSHVAYSAIIHRPSFYRLLLITNVFIYYLLIIYFIYYDLFIYYLSIVKNSLHTHTLLF